MSAVLYIVMGVPLFLCWISVFFVILAVSVLVISGEMRFLFALVLEFVHYYISGYYANKSQAIDEFEGEEFPEKTGIWLALAEGDTVVKPFIFTKQGTNPSTADHGTKELKIGTKAFKEGSLLIQIS